MTRRSQPASPYAWRYLRGEEYAHVVDTRSEDRQALCNKTPGRGEDWRGYLTAYQRQAVLGKKVCGCCARSKYERERVEASGQASHHGRIGAESGQRTGRR